MNKGFIIAALLLLGGIFISTQGKFVSVRDTNPLNHTITQSGVIYGTMKVWKWNWE